MTWEYENAGPGNIALMAELPRQAVLALGFGSSRIGSNPCDLQSAAALR
jgi:Glucodextranase, domain N